MRILVLTDVLPAPIISSKKQENDVLLLTASLHEQSSTARYTFVYLVPYSNYFLSLFSIRWKEYYEFIKLGQYVIAGRRITIMSVPYFTSGMPFKGLLIKLGYLLNRRKLKQLLGIHDIDLVHAHNVSSDAGIAYHLFKESGVPYVVTTRKLGNRKPDPVFTPYLKQAKALLNLGYAQQALAAALNAHAYLVPHGIDERFLSCQKSYDASARPFRMVSLCRLLPWKNIDQVLRALGQFNGDVAIEYDIYGDGPDLARLQAMVEGGENLKSRVRFLGHIPYEQVPGTLIHYDLFILPSYVEMFGRVYVEAMACGLPVIGAKNCGIAGYIEDGVQGFLVDHREVAEIRQAITRFLSDHHLKIRMGQQAKELSAHFSWKEIVTRINDIYQLSLGADVEVIPGYHRKPVKEQEDGKG